MAITSLPQGALQWSISRKGLKMGDLKSGDTVQPMLMQRGFSGESRTATQYLAAFAAGIGAIVAGTILAWSSPALPQLSSANSTLPITNEESSWIGSILAIGALFAAIPIGMMAEAIGRKKTIIFLVVPFMINWILISFANGVIMLYVARFFAGVGTGGICVTAPMYIGEIAEPAIRGALGAFFQLFLTVGILFTYVVGAFTTWRVLSYICAVIPIIFGLVFLFMPETPQYLLKKCNLRGAESSLRWLRGPDYDITKEMEDMQKDVDNAAKNKASLTDLIRNRANLYALICSLGLMFFQQVSGINAVIFYTNFIFESAGSKIDPHLSTIIIGIVQTVFTIVSSLLIDKAGRRILLLQSSICMGICLTTLGVYFKLKIDEADVSNIGWLPLASMIIFIISFSMGLGPIPWMMMGELFSAECKGIASGIAVMVNWLLVFVVTKAFPTMDQTIGSHFTYWIFALFMLCSLFFVFFLIPETKGKTNAEIQEKLAGK